MHKSSRYKGIRRPLPKFSQQQLGTSKQPLMFIDQQIENFLEKECPGKLKKFLRQRVKQKNFTQPGIQFSHCDQKQSKIFEKTFYRERTKAHKQNDRIKTMKDKLQHILKLDQRPPSPFFQLSRKRILSLQRQSLMQFHSDTFNTSGKIKTQSQNYIKAKKYPIHPIFKISQRTYQSVSQQFRKRSKDRIKQIINFSPFGNVQPIDFT